MILVIIVIRINSSHSNNSKNKIREVGGAPRNPAPRNSFLVWIVKPSGCHCTGGHLTSRVWVSRGLTQADS